MKKINLLSIVIAICIVVASSFGSISYGKSTKKTILKVNNIYCGDSVISGTTTSSATVKAYYGSKQIGKSVLADRNGNFKISKVSFKQAGKIVKVKSSKKNYTTNQVSVKVSPKYLGAYKKFLEKQLYWIGEDENSVLRIGGEKEKFFLKDINNDNIKELIIVNQYSKYAKVYTYANGAVKLCGTNEERLGLFIDASNRLARRVTNSGVDQYAYLTIDSKNRLYKIAYEVVYDYQPINSQQGKVYKTYYKSIYPQYPGSDEGNYTQKTISKSTFDKAVKKAAYKKSVTRYFNTKSNREKYLR